MLTESHGAAHFAAEFLRVVFHAFFLKHTLAETVDTADEFGGVVKVDFLGFGVAGFLGEFLGKVFFVDSQHPNFVIREKSLADGVREINAEKFFAEDFLVVHRIQHRIVLIGFCLDVGGKNLRRGGHIHTLTGADKVVVVNTHVTAFDIVEDVGCAAC